MEAKSMVAPIFSIKIEAPRPLFRKCWVYLLYRELVLINSNTPPPCDAKPLATRNAMSRVKQISL